MHSRLSMMVPILFPQVGARRTGSRCSRPRGTAPAPSASAARGSRGSGTWTPPGRSRRPESASRIQVRRYVLGDTSGWLLQLLLTSTQKFRHIIDSLYGARVTHQVGSNLPLSLIWKFRTTVDAIQTMDNNAVHPLSIFGAKVQLYSRRNFAKSTSGLSQRSVPFDWTTLSSRCWMRDFWKLWRLTCGMWSPPSSASILKLSGS